MYTDGVVESVDSREQQFGEERLLETLKELASLPAEMSATRVTERLMKWAGRNGSGALNDDVTMMIVDL